MCGIAGQLALDPLARPDAAAVRAMTGAMAHRGPDGDGFYDDGPVALGHRRLSIIDLAGGAQPIENEDGSVVVVFNGEIYNYQELIPPLEAKGHVFRTRSDTEVLVHLYEERGPELVRDLVGMFAFALWDKRRGRLVLARDRFGEKPLVYAERGGSLVFASELNALRRHPLVAAPSIDREALGLYLSLLYVPAPLTIWQGVKKLPAGHVLVAEGGRAKLVRYWAPPPPGRRTPSPGEAREELDRLLGESVKLRMRSDVPVGALLSGGLDSSAVVLHMARHAAKLHTFTVAFDGDASEAKVAREVAAKLGAEHHELRVELDVPAVTRRAAALYGEPFGDTSSVPTLAICEAARAHVKVLLTGDGGDEVFGGYERYLVFPRLLKLSAVPGAAAAGLSRLFAMSPRLRKAGLALTLAQLPPPLALLEWLSVFRRVDREALLGGDAPDVLAAMPPELRELSPGDLPLAFDAGVYLPQDLLLKVDGASMASSLETRAPMLDHRLAEAMMGVDPAVRLAGGVTKALLRDYLGEKLGRALAARPKQGFGAPAARWLRGPLKELALELLDPSARAWTLVDGEAGRGVVEAWYAGRRTNEYQVWSLLMLELWARSAEA